MTFVKNNHHYVPQFWQRRFCDSTGKLYGRIGSQVKQTNSRHIMQADWAYTIFDHRWIPSDELEDALSVQEGKAAPLFERLCTAGTIATFEERNGLCDFLALQACRHPDIMRRGHRRAMELGKVLASVSDYKSDRDFAEVLAGFGVARDEAQNMYHILIAIHPDQLGAELNELLALSPQDPQLPEQDALLAQEKVSKVIRAMNLTLLDAPTGATFVLGDTPMPQTNLSLGFVVPLSKSVAIEAVCTSGSPTSIGRRVATAIEVDRANQTQWENALQTVVGSEKSVLAALQ